MNISPNVNLERIEEADLKLQSQLNKCLNEKRRRQSEIGYLDELAGFISAGTSDMCSLSVKPDKCAILQETVNHIRRIKLAEECGSSDDLQQSEVSSSKPNILGNDVLGPLLLQALDGFLFVVNTDGKIEFVSANVKSFLKYSQESLVDKSIYNIIHVGDHARFSSSLLPMSIGNGFGWSEPNNKSRSFACRFLIKPPEDQEETMEEKQTRVSQYENMQISAVLLPPSGEKPENEDLDRDIQNQNHLVCVARRMPPNEKSNLTGVEQFSTRLDMRGKIVSIDTSGVSSTYSQFLNKDLVGRIIQDLCHPDDFQKLTQHLKETLQQGSNTSGVYRLRLAHDRFVHVQTKSKRFNYNPMANEQEVIVATHSIIRDSDHLESSSIVVSQRSNPSPANDPIVRGIDINMNGNFTLPCLSPQEFNLIDLDIFPSSSWDLGGGNNDAMQDLGGDSGNTNAATASVPTSSSSSGGNPPTPASVNSQRTHHPSGNAFSPELGSTKSPARLSPAPGRATPFTSTFPFSPPVPTQSRTSSPAPAKRDELAGNPPELPNVSPMDAQNSNNATQKLRNLLTHGIEEADSSVPKNSSNEKLDDGAREGDNNYASRSENIILRELLNQEDEEANDDATKNLQCDSNGNMNLPSDMCSADALQKRTVNNNNMLRKLLNNDEDKSYRKNQDILIQQLLKTEGKVSSDSGLPPTPKSGSSGLPGSASDVINSVVKRKSPDTPTDDPMAKRSTSQNPQHAHLAGQNPMLASMLAQIPRTTPSVPTSIANAIVSQLPQERLPKNLEKKLVHTPYTGAPTSGSNSATNTQYSYTQVQGGSTRSLLSTSLQQEVVTADSRGHVTLAPQNSHLNQQGFLGKMPPPSENAQVGGMQGNYMNRFNSHQQSSVQQSNANLLFDGALTDVNNDPNNMVGASDPLLSEILDQVWSMEQDMRIENTTTDDLALYKLLEEIPDPTPTAAASPRPPPVQDVNEKMAINAIQRQLMSFEAAAAPNVPRNATRFQQPASMSMQQPQVASNAFNQYQPAAAAAAPPAYAMASAPQRMRNPNVHPGGNMMLSSQQMVQMNNQRQSLQQYNSGGLASLNDLPPQMKRQLIEHRQKLFLHQQQKRLLMQQKQLSLNTRQALPDNMQTLQSPTPASFTENMNDLMNNTVAPNVTLQRSTSMPEPQLSPRYSNVQQMPNSAPPPPSPSQLSPGQRQQPPFSPLAQQGYPNNYPQSRLSPHIQTQPPGSQTWQPRSSQNQVNLQQQNPMLNAQLSQGGFGSQAARFTNQQQQQQPRQMVARSMPSPGSRNSPYSNPPDSPFHPPSPGVAMYQQQATAMPQQPPQQRLQRAVSIPNRINSPRGLQAGFTGGDPILSPQPSPGNYNPPPPPVSSYNSAMPVSTSSNYNSDTFSYDQQGYPQAMMERSRNNAGGGAMTSEYVRQELRAMVGARTQQQHQVHQQQLVQQIPQTGGSQSTSQSLIQADFEALGFSLDLGNDGQPSSPALFPQSLLSVAGGTENHARTDSPRFQLEEQRPTEQKKSLLQQLLSEPP